MHRAPLEPPAATRRDKRGSGSGAPACGLGAPARAAALCLALLAAAGGVARADRAYVVEPGDTLYALAARFDTTVAVLRSVNGITGNLLRPGDVLRVPATPASGYRTTIAGAGETLEDVAARVGRTAATLASANPVLARSGVRAGAPVSVPPADGVTVVAGAADSLASLAARAGASEADLAQLNGLEPGAALAPGQPVLLPAGTTADAVAPAATAAATAAPAVTAGPSGVTTPKAPPASAAPASTVPASTAPASAAPAPSLVASAAPPQAAPDAVGGGGRARLEGMQNAALLAAVVRLPQVRLASDSFVEPVQGRLSSPFGWRALSVDGNHFHAGIDLAVPAGTPVHAARDGTVVEARWDGTYGNVVFLDHGDGSQTRYAHLSRIAVRDGDALRQGDVLGYAGSTGWSTGPHVHFELRFDGRAVDPLDYLRSAVVR